MFKKKDIKILETIEKNWLNFIHERNKKKFEKGIADGWLTMIERERMLSEFVRIFQTIKKKKVVYE